MFLAAVTVVVVVSCTCDNVSCALRRSCSNEWFFFVHVDCVAVINVQARSQGTLTRAINSLPISCYQLPMGLRWGAHLPDIGR